MSELPINNDFLNQKNEVKLVKKRRTSLEVEMDKFSEYYSLNEYQRKCLVATNYFRVLYGLYEIQVPPSDEHYYKYFDNKCYERAENYKKMKQRELYFKENFSKLTFSKKQSNVIQNEPTRQDKPCLAENEASQNISIDKSGRIGYNRKETRLAEEKKEEKIINKEDQLNLF